MDQRETARVIESICLHTEDLFTKKGKLYHILWLPFPCFSWLENLHILTSSFTTYTCKWNKSFLVLLCSPDLPACLTCLSVPLKQIVVAVVHGLWWTISLPSWGLRAERFGNTLSRSSKASNGKLSYIILHSPIESRAICRLLRTFTMSKFNQASL